MKLPRLRDMPIAIRLWIFIISFVIPCFLIMGFAFRNTLIFTRDETVFSSIEKSQTILKNGKISQANETEGIIPAEYDAVLSVYHIGIVDRQVKYMTFPSAKFQSVSVKFIGIMGTSYSSQTEPLKKYKLSASGYNLYYIIAKSGTDGVISFRVDSLSDDVYNNVGMVVAAFAGGSVILLLLLAFLFSQTLALPLRKLEKAAARTAAGDLDTPVMLDRNDEIGRLSKEIDKARCELKSRDLMRQSAIQYVSHELKTPIMTISSYAQAIRDKIYPRGDLESSVKVIEAQADRLQGIVMKLLTLTRLDYLESRPLSTQTFDLAGIAEDICARAGAARRDVRVELGLDDVVMEGPREEIEVMAENLLENAFRHADACVCVKTGETLGRPYLRIYNDGGGIDENLLPNLFETFKKGKKGVTGLGLSIVKRIADSCGAEITVQNRDGGVEFEVLFQQDSYNG